MRAGEEREPVVAVAAGPRRGEERVARDDEGGHVRGAAAWAGDAAGTGPGEAEEAGQFARGRFFDDGEGR